MADTQNRTKRLNYAAIPLAIPLCLEAAIMCPLGYWPFSAYLLLLVLLLLTLREKWLLSVYWLIHLLIVPLTLLLTWLNNQSIFYLIAAGAIIIPAGSALFLARNQRIYVAFAQHKEAAKAAIWSAVLVTVTLCLLQWKKHGPVLLLFERFFPGAGWLQAGIGGLYAAWLTAHYLTHRKKEVVRARLWTLFSSLFFLQFFGGLAGIERLLMTGAYHIPVPAMVIGGPLYRGHGFFMPLLFLSTIVFVGPAWCSFLCYFGAWDFVAARKKKKPQSISTSWLWLRMATLAVVVIGALVLKYLNFSTSFAVGSGVAFGVFGLLIITCVSPSKGQMLHCQTYCPLGMFAVLLGKISPFRLAIGDSCTECNACQAFCRYNALTSKHIQRKRPGFNCTLCMDCIRTCPHNSLSVTCFGKKSPMEKYQKVFTVLVLSFHAVFLFIAMV